MMKFHKLTKSLLKTDIDFRSNKLNKYQFICLLN